MSRVIVCLMAIFAASSAWAGVGVRGGGEVVDVDGKLYMRDLVEQSKCEWMTGQDMMDAVPETASLLASVAKLDWYFALELKRELRYLHFCMTGSLKPLLSVDERNIPAESSDLVSRFVGVRFEGTVNVDRSLFGRLSPRMQALFLVHETMHSYLPMDMDPAIRRRSLFSIVNTIHQVAEGQITTRARLHLNMQEDHVDFPRTVAQLDPYRTQLEFILADDIDRKAIYLANALPERLTQGHYEKVAAAAASWDRDALTKTPEAIQTDAIELILSAGSEDEIDFVLNRQLHDTVSPMMIAMAGLLELSPEQQAKLTAKIDPTALVPAALASLGSAKAELRGDRIAATPKLQELAGMKGSLETVPVMQLKPIAAEQALPTELKALANLIVGYADAGRWDSIGSEIGSRDGFYSTLRLEPAKQSISALNPLVAREKEYALKAVDRMACALAARLQQYLEGELGTDLYAQVGRKIDWQKLNNNCK